MNRATMRPTRHKGNRLRLHEKTLKTLGSGNMLDAVTIPAGEDEDEWLVRWLTHALNPNPDADTMLLARCHRMCATIMSLFLRPLQLLWPFAALSVTPLLPVATVAPAPVLR